MKRQAPKGVQTEEELMRLQHAIGAAQTGVWDSASKEAYQNYLKRFSVPLTTAYQAEGYAAPGIVRNQKDVKIIREVPGDVTVDGIWGPETDSSYWAKAAAENAAGTTSVKQVSSSADIATEIKKRSTSLQGIRQAKNPSLSQSLTTRFPILILKTKVFRTTSLINRSPHVRS